jgi:hypothetical protein
MTSFGGRVLTLFRAVRGVVDGGFSFVLPVFLRQPVGIFNYTPGRKSLKIGVSKKLAVK